MEHYRIAYFTTDWNSEIMIEMLKGLRAYALKHEDVTVCVFDCFGKADSSGFSEGEFAIYDLPDFSAFDGVLLQSNQIPSEEQRKKLYRKLSECGLPVITIEEYVEGFYCYGVDNRAAMRAIIDHVVLSHNAKSVTYLDGLSISFEAQQRKQAYLDACEEYGIKPDVLPGAWEAKDGRAAAWELIRRPDGLPDALISANDNMAIGACEVFKSEGYQVPEDVIVTGFDNTESAALHNPRITTLERPYKKMAFHALEKLVSLIQGNDEPLISYEEFQPVFSMSCGCDLTEEERGESLRARSFITSRGMKRFYGSQEKMASRLFEAGGLDEVASIVMEHFTSLGSSHAYVCFNESYVENYQKFQWMRTDTFDENMVLFTHTQQLEIKDGHVYPHFLKRDLLPGELLDREQVIIFFPLHHRHYIMGYIGVSFTDEATPVNFRSTFSLIDLATENVRKRAVLMDMNERLENLYVMDSLTGLYNRFGLEQFGTRFFDEAMAQGKTVKLLFVDMDGMKEINDTLGHESGDQAIKATADILVRSCPRNDFIMRFGGDEFIVIGTDTGEDTAGRIRENVEEYNRNRRESFTLSLSIGEMPVSASDHLTLSECVTRADDRMYEDKKRRKAERN